MMTLGCRSFRTVASARQPCEAARDFWAYELEKSGRLGQARYNVPDVNLDQGPQAYEIHFIGKVLGLGEL